MAGSVPEVHRRATSRTGPKAKGVKEGTGAHTFVPAVETCHWLVDATALTVDGKAAFTSEERRTVDGPPGS